MDAERYRRTVSLICSTCAAGDFEYLSSDGPLRCTSCSRIFMRDELIAENGHVIAGQVDEVKAELVRDLATELRDRLSRTFRGSKHVRIR